MKFLWSFSCLFSTLVFCLYFAFFVFCFVYVLNKELFRVWWSLVLYRIRKSTPRLQGVLINMKILYQVFIKRIVNTSNINFHFLPILGAHNANYCFKTKKRIKICSSKFRCIKKNLSNWKPNLQRYHYLKAFSV